MTTTTTTNTIITNRTPHRIDVLARDGVTPITSYPAARREDVARVEVITDPHASIIATDGGDVPILSQRWGAVISLPRPADGVYHIVSAIVAAAAIAQGRGARDLLVPGDQVRDGAGRIVGCRGLVLGEDAMPHLSIGAEVWVCHTTEELEALGVPQDLIGAASSVAGGMYRIERSTSPASEQEMAAWNAMARLYRSHFGGDVRPRNSGGVAQRVERFDVAELAEALLHRPHRSTIASSL